MPFPIPSEIVLTGLGGLGGIGSGFAVFRHFASKWADEREAAERRLRDDLDGYKEICVTRNSTVERESQVERARLETLFRTGLDDLRKHADTELQRVSNRNHELSNSLGVVMNEMQNQRSMIVLMTESIEVLVTKVADVTTAIAALTARLEGANLLRRNTDRGNG